MVKIATSEGREIFVAANYEGKALAVTPFYLGHNRFTTSSWTITHIPTGRAIVQDIRADGDVLIQRVKIVDSETWQRWLEFDGCSPLTRNTRYLLKTLGANVAPFIFPEKRLLQLLHHLWEAEKTWGPAKFPIYACPLSAWQATSPPSGWDGKSKHHQLRWWGSLNRYECALICWWVADLLNVDLYTGFIHMQKTRLEVQHEGQSKRDF